jgi:hypothetical protein
MNELKFANEQLAAEFLFSESTAILNKNRVKFVIVGGWVSYLFNHNLFGHPGTFDTDVLLDSSSIDDGSFDKSTESMLAMGYLRAAKNRFQLHRILNVRGEDVLFHVDFLNEQEPGNTLELQTGNGRIKSIYTPAMKVVFQYEKFRYHSDFAEVRFPSEETFIATKAVATIVNKRERDAFDIFVTLKGSGNYGELQGNWRRLVEFDGFFQDANECLWKSINEGDGVRKIKTIIESLNAIGKTTDSDILETFNSFLIIPNIKR